MTRLVVVSAGLSVPSSTTLLAERLTAAVAAQLPGVDVTHVELRDLAHPIADNLLTGFPSGALADASRPTMCSARSPMSIERTLT